MFGYYLHDKSFTRDHEILSAEKEKELLERYKYHGDQRALDVLVYKNQRLIRQKVDRHKDWRAEWEDLYSAANEGLLKAIHRFEPEMGGRLSTYAVQWINERIFSLKEQKPVVHIPRHAQHKLNRELKPVGDQEVLNQLSPLSQGVYQASTPHQQLVCEMSQDERFHSNRPCEFTAVENALSVTKLAEHLDDKELEMITTHFGIGKDSEISMRKMAPLYGISDMTINKIVARGLAKMREAAEETHAEPAPKDAEVVSCELEAKAG